MHRKGYEAFAERLFAGEANFDPTYKRTFQEDRLVLTSEVESYRYRHPKLHHLSALEVGMMFDVRPTKKLIFAFDDEHKLHFTHGHVFRKRVHLPQFVMKFPKRPSSEAEDVDKEAYAAFVLCLFHPWHTDDDDDMPGVTLWDKYMHWRATQPRGLLDRLAIQMLDGADLQVRARSYKDNNRTVMFCMATAMCICFVTLPPPQFVKYLRQYVRSCKNPEGARDGRRQKRPRPPDDEYEVEKMFDEEYASSIVDAMDANLDSLLHSPLVDDAMHGFPPMDETSFPKTPDAACVVSYHRLALIKTVQTPSLSHDDAGSQVHNHALVQQGFVKEPSGERICMAINCFFGA